MIILHFPKTNSFVPSKNAAWDTILSAFPEVHGRPSSVDALGDTSSTDATDDLQRFAQELKVGKQAIFFFFWGGGGREESGSIVEGIKKDMS